MCDAPTSGSVQSGGRSAPYLDDVIRDACMAYNGSEAPGPHQAGIDSSKAAFVLAVIPRPPDVVVRSADDEYSSMVESTPCPIERFRRIKRAVMAESRRSSNGERVDRLFAMTVRVMEDISNNA